MKKDNENRPGQSSDENGHTSEIVLAARRSRIEHTRNVELSEQEIAARKKAHAEMSEQEIIARKKAHAERRARQQKNKKAAEGKKQGKNGQAASGKQGSSNPARKQNKNGKPARKSFEQARYGSDDRHDVIGRAKPKPYAEQPQEMPEEMRLPEQKPVREIRLPDTQTDPMEMIDHEVIAASAELPEKPEKKEKPVKRKKSPKREKKTRQKKEKKQPDVKTSEEIPSEPFVRPHFKPVEMPSYIERPEDSSAEDHRAIETVDMQDFRRRRKRLKMRKRLKRLLLVLVLVCIVAAVYFTRGLWVPKLEGILEKPKETIVNDGVEESGNYPIDLSEGTVTAISRLDGSVVTVDNSHYTVYQSDGKMKDAVYHTLGSPVVRSAGKRMLLFDNGSDTFKLYNRNGMVYEKKLDSTIVYGAAASNGSVLIVTVNDKYTAELFVFDKNGNELYKWSDGDRIMDASFSSSGESFTVSTFSVHDGKLMSKITRVELTENHAVTKSEEIEGLVIRAAENSKGNIWAMTADKLFLLSDIGEIIGSYEFPSQPVTFDMCSDCVCAVTRQITSDQTVISIFDAQSGSAEPKQITPTSGSPKKVACFDSMAFVLSSNSLDAYAADSSLVATAAVKNEYSDFVYCDNAVYLLGKREMNKIVFKT